jgi:hypothetical protein
MSDESAWYAEDERLLAELGTAVRKGDEVPESFTRMGKGAIVWRTVDAELAALAFDSAAAGPGGLRSADGGPRELSFAAGNLTIELEIHPDAVRGQLVPPGPGLVLVRLVDGPGATAEADEVGWFQLVPPPERRFRLQVRTPQASVLSDWIDQP